MEKQYEENLNPIIPVSPGDNPNKRGASRKSKFTPKKKNVSYNAYTQRDYIDPTISPPLTPTGIRDVLVPGGKIIGNITLDDDMFLSFERMIIDVVDAARSSLSRRIDFPEVVPVLRTIIPLCFATQLYETLQLINESSKIFKLKSLKYGDVPLPEFCIPFIQSIGHFESREGVIKINGCETLILRLLHRAVDNFDDFVYRIPGMVDEPNDLIAWDSFDFSFTRDKICENYFNVLSNEIYTFHGVSVRLPLFRRFDNAADYAWSVSQVTGDLAIGHRAYQHCLFYNMETYGDFVNGSFDYIQFNDWIGLYPSSRSVNDYVSYTSFIFSWLKANYSYVFDKLFSTKSFTPVAQGTSCQFVKKNSEEVYSGSSSSASHSYELNGTEAAKGFVLLPASEVNFEPKYVIDSEVPRSFHLGSLAGHGRMEK